MAEPVTAGLSAAKWIGSLRPGYWTKRHNRIVEREYEDRVRWVRDQSRKEETGLAILSEAMNAFNLVHSSKHDNEQKQVHDTFAQQWRDRKSQGHRVIEDAHDEETPVHWIWRRIVRRTWPKDPFADEVASLTRGWDLHSP